MQQVTDKPPPSLLFAPISVDFVSFKGGLPKILSEKNLNILNLFCIKKKKYVKKIDKIKYLNWLDY